MSVYDTDLDKNPANYQPLTPITYLERAARVFPDYVAIVHGRRRVGYGEFWRRSLKPADTLKPLLLSAARACIDACDTRLLYSSTSMPCLSRVRWFVAVACRTVSP